VKVTELDVARKRIALSIKQTEEAPIRKERQNFNYKGNSSQQKFDKRQPEPVVEMGDALALLKKKFGK
jgi:uncharacterized protein